MKVPKADGFVLVLVIVALSLTAVVMAVLTAGANTMLFHADRAHCQAVQRNLRVSGLTWAQARLTEPDRTVPSEPVELDAGAFGARATLIVSLPAPDSSPSQIQIETACSKGRQALSAARTHTLPSAQ